MGNDEGKENRILLDSADDAEAAAKDEVLAEDVRGTNGAAAGKPRGPVRSGFARELKHGPAETAEDLNGLIGDPEWVATFGVSVFRGPLAFFYSGNYVGKSDTTRKLSNDSTILYFGETYDAVMYTDAVVYHNLSVSYEWDNGFRALLGVANLTAEDPPQVTTQGGTEAEIDYIGNSVFYSQYDWFGRRVFANLTWNFQ